MLVRTWKVTRALSKSAFMGPGVATPLHIHTCTCTCTHMAYTHGIHTHTHTIKTRIHQTHIHNIQNVHTYMHLNSGFSPRTRLAPNSQSFTKEIQIKRSHGTYTSIGVGTNFNVGMLWWTGCDHAPLRSTWLPLGGSGGMQGGRTSSKRTW